MAKPTIPHSVRRSVCASRATTAGVGGFPLLAILVYVANEYPAFEAGTRTLQASVVRLYGVVVILGEWVRVGCARLSRVHSLHPFCGPGSGVSPAPAGPFLYPTCSLYRLFIVCAPFVCRL
jgi:hypothetical protein